MPKFSRKKIRPMSLVPRSRIPDSGSGLIYLKGRRSGAKIPLRNEFGLLNGVYETPKGEVVEIRHVPRETLPLDYGKKGPLWGWAAPRINIVVGEELIGEASPSLGHRMIDEEYRGMGIGEKLYDFGERALAASNPKLRGRIKLSTAKENVAGFLLKRGYKGYGEKDREMAEALSRGRRQEKRLEGKGITLIKPVKSSEFDDPKKWHRIEVVGRDGKTKFLTLRVLPIEVPRQSRRALRKVA